jgi:hypothetical protein
MVFSASGLLQLEMITLFCFCLYWLVLIRMVFLLGRKVMKIKIVCVISIVFYGGSLFALSPQTNALFSAVKQGDLQGLYDAVAAGANIVAQDGAGNRPLVYAVTVNMNPDIIRALVDAGAPLTNTNKALVDILTLAVDKAVEDYRFLNNLKALLQKLDHSMDIKNAINLITVQLSKLTLQHTQLNNVPANKTKINNILNAMNVLDNSKKELIKSAQIQKDMAAEDRIGYNQADLNR